jgi:hypothetical protein
MNPSVSDRIAKLLRLALSNGLDGERLAAIGRLSALAAAHDIDWDEAFASNGNGSALSQEDMQRIYAAGYERAMQDAAASKPSADDWAPAGRARATEVGSRLEEVEQILEAAKRYQNDGLLDQWFSDFSESMRARISRYGA